MFHGHLKSVVRRRGSRALIVLALAFTSVALPTGGAEAASCDANRTCSGTLKEFFRMMLVADNHVRLITVAGPLASRLTGYGCEENWSLWIHEKPNGYGDYLNQLYLAQEYGETLLLIFNKRHAGHCDLEYMYRYLQGGP